MSVIELLNRDRARKVEPVPCATGISWGKCPSCKKALFIYGKLVRMNFCHFCGQRLTWWEGLDEEVEE